MNQRNRFIKIATSSLIFASILCILLASTTGSLLPIPEKWFHVCESERREGSWKYNEQSNVFLVQGQTDKIDQTAQSFVSSVSAIIGKELLLNSGKNVEGSGNYDILLIADEKTGIEEEGYDIVVEGGRLLIRASDENGLFYGCAEVIKQMQENGQAGSVYSAPDTPERALLLDIARKYYTPSWIKELIKELESAKMNTLIFHFSDEMGLGLESKKYPWLNGRDGTLCTQCEVPTDNRQITQAEMADLVSYAKMHHIQIVPSFDTPGHMNYIVKQFNARCASAAFSFTYLDKVYEAPAGTDIGNYYHTNGKIAIVQGTRNTEYSRGIDITNEYAIAFTKSLLDEYASFFRSLGCRKFDMGGDEMLGWGDSPNASLPKWQQLDHWKEAAVEATGNKDAVAYDYFLLYMNDLYEMLTSSKYGYTSVRMWNDEAMRSADTGWKEIVQLNTNIDRGIEGPDHRKTLLKMEETVKEGIAPEIGAESVIVFTNLQEYLNEPFLAVECFRNASVILTLQKLWNVFYVSTSYDYSVITYEKDNCGYCDNFLFALFSTENTAVHPVGGGASRIKKLEALSSFPPAYRYLHPCFYVSQGHNCSACVKCIRTMTALDVLGTLQKFDHVFDIHLFESKKDEYYAQIFSQSGDVFSYEIISAMNERGQKLTEAAQRKAHLLTAARKVVKNHEKMLKSRFHIADEVE